MNKEETIVILKNIYYNSTYLTLEELNKLNEILESIKKRDNNDSNV